MSKRLTLEEKEQIIFMRNQGNSWQTIAIALGRPNSKGILCSRYKSGFVSTCKYECVNCGEPTNSERKLCNAVACRKIAMCEFQKENRAKYIYGTSQDELDQLWINQNGRCAIPLCDVLIDWPCSSATGVGVPSHVDHDHSTGVIRGLLCPTHNKGLGFFDDSADMLMSAVEYLLDK